MIFETSRQARFLIPMALSLGFGILFATLITLVLVPSLFLAVEDGKHALARMRLLMGGAPVAVAVRPVQYDQDRPVAPAPKGIAPALPASIDPPQSGLQDTGRDTIEQ